MVGCSSSTPGRVSVFLGPAGLVNLSIDIMDKYGGTWAMNTPPALYKNLAILAGRTGESGRYGVPGDPRAFDLLTGKEVWRFHIVPYDGEKNDGTWGLNGWQDRRSAGVWVPMAVDVENDLVFVPTGNATNQNFGGSRPGTNLYRHVGRGAPRVDGRARVALPARAPRHLRLGHELAAVDLRHDHQRTARAGHRADDEAGTSVHVQPPDRRTALRRRGASRRLTSTRPAIRHGRRSRSRSSRRGLTRDGMTRKEVSKISPEAEKYCTELYDKVVNMGPFTPVRHAPEPRVPGV